MKKAKQPRSEKGLFGSAYREPRGEPIALRLPKSLDTILRQAAGDQLKLWVEQAIAEKLEREAVASEKVRPSEPSHLEVVRC